MRVTWIVNPPASADVTTWCQTRNRESGRPPQTRLLFRARERHLAGNALDAHEMMRERDHLRQNVARAGPFFAVA